VRPTLAARFFPVLAALLVSAAGSARQTLPLAPHQQLAHDVYKELIEFNTGPTHGTTAAAQAMLKRFRAAGFPASVPEEN